ncbi:hypothetical protein V6N12_009998 [Hibiscus sabdariffa]|uniref:Uncharacterized protein n=1 Tax=Hibiscus sabdariffa TaxID=183260 RepID=A0ABR2ECS8_9ROSI
MATDSLMDGGIGGRPPDPGLGAINSVGFVNIVGNADVVALNESQDGVVCADSLLIVWRRRMLGHCDVLP